MIKKSKGQYFSLDAIVASLIFILAIMTLLSYWYSVRSSIEKQDSELLKEAFRVSDLLFTPSTGNGDCRIGFADNWNYKILNYTSIEKCKTVSNEEIKGKLGTGANVVIVIKNVEVGNSMEPITIGTPPNDIKDAAKIQRSAAIRIDGNPSETFIATIEITLYN